MRELLTVVSDNNAVFLLSLAVVNVFLLFYAGVLARRIGRLRKTRSAKFAEATVGGIADSLAEQATSIERIEADLNAVGEREARLAAELGACLRHVGIVRYNAFDDVGGEQSFSMAMVDSRGDGVVVSSIFGRQDNRFYAKTVTAGKSGRTLSQEEQEALRKAME